MIKLTDGIAIVTREPHKVQEGLEVWRVDVAFYSMRPKVAKVRADYEVWATVEFIEDFLRLPKFPTKKKMEKFAVEFIKKRFSECGRVIPEKYGAFCSNTTGIKLVKHSGTLLSYFNDLKSAEKKMTLSDKTVG